jgi:sulfur-oxidizing protein SoxZ
MSSIRIKAKDRKGLVDVKCLMKHDMETGLRKDKSGKKFLSTGFRTSLLKQMGRWSFRAAFKRQFQKTPYLAFAFAGKKGDS